MIRNSRTPSKGRVLAGYGAAAALLAAAPLYLSDFRLNLLAKFLALGIVALGIDLLWGYAGVLSLGQGVFFGMGAYCMAMHLKLEATEGKLPDFMSWSGLDRLPAFWVPFQNFAFALAMAVLLPAFLAFVLGWFTFRNRVHGVYFTILTQALVIIAVTLLVGQQGYTGGTNGITSFKTVFGFPLSDPAVKTALYYVTAAALAGSFLFCRRIAKSRLGRVLQAIREGENRVRFFGYDPAAYKSFAFAVSAGLAGLSGMLYVFHVGIISPSMMGIVPSIEMVLWVAAGGRGTLIGAVVGALVLNGAKSLISEAYPDIWLLFLGAMFVIVVVLMPKGLFGTLPSWAETVHGKVKPDETGAVGAVVPKRKRLL